MNQVSSSTPTPTPTTSFSAVKTHLKKILYTAILIGAASVLKLVSPTLSIMGAPSLRISLSPVFFRMPAILFGPFYGGIAGGIVDIIGFLLKPQGPYMPWLTLTAVVDGLISSFVWRFLKDRSSRSIQKGIWILFISIGGIGLFNIAVTGLFPSSSIALALESMGNKKDYMLLGLLVVAVIALLLLALDFVLRKKSPEASVSKYYLKVVLTFLITGIPITILNSYILTFYYTNLKSIFVLFLLPRLLEELIMAVLLSYVTAFLLSVYDRFILKEKKSNDPKISSSSHS